MLYNAHILSALHIFLVCSAAIYPQNVFLRHLCTFRIEVKSFLGVKPQHISQDLQIVFIANIFGRFVFRVTNHTILAVPANKVRIYQSGLSGKQPLRTLSNPIHWMIKYIPD